MDDIDTITPTWRRPVTYMSDANFTPSGRLVYPETLLSTKLFTPVLEK